MHQDSTSTSDVNNVNVVEFPNSNFEASVKRTAEEIRRKFLQNNASETAPYKMRAIACAAVSPISDGAFRLFVIREIYADKDGGNSRPTQDVLEELMRCDARSIRNFETELKSEGFMTLVRRANNRSKNPTERAATYRMISTTDVEVAIRSIITDDRKKLSALKIKNDRKGFSTGTFDRKEVSTGNTFHRKNFTRSTGKDFPPTLCNNPIKKDIYMSVPAERDDYIMCPEVEPEFELQPEPLAPPAKPKRPRKRKAANYSDAFNAAWMAYPRSPTMSKIKAWENWERNGCEEIAETVIAAARAEAERCRREGVKPEFVKHMQGWITDRRWEGMAESAEKARVIAEEQQVKAIALGYATRNWEPAMSLWRTAAEIPERLKKLAKEYAAREFGYVAEAT